MQCGIAAVLDPLAVLLRVKIRDPQRSMSRPSWRIRFDVRDKTDKSRIPLEDHVELAHLIALHPIRTLRVDIIPFHVTVEAFDHRARTFEIAEPILSVRCA